MILTSKKPEAMQNTKLCYNTGAIYQLSGEPIQDHWSSGYIVFWNVSVGVGEVEVREGL